MRATRSQRRVRQLKHIFGANAHPNDTFRSVQHIFPEGALQSGDGMNALFSLTPKNLPSPRLGIALMQILGLDGREDHCVPDKHFARVGSCFQSEVGFQQGNQSAEQITKFCQFTCRQAAE